MEVHLIQNQKLWDNQLHPIVNFQAEKNKERNSGVYIREKKMYKNLLSKKNDLEISMKNTTTMAIIYSINELLKVLSCFIFFKSTSSCLKNIRTIFIIIMQIVNYHMIYMENLKLQWKLTILSNSSPPVTNSKTMYIFVLLAIT